MEIPNNFKDLRLARAVVKDKVGEVLTYARLMVTGKPLISVRDEGNGAVSLTEGYFGNRTKVNGLRFEDLPMALEHRMISEDAAMEAFRFMVKRKTLIPANENE